MKGFECGCLTGRIVNKKCTDSMEFHRLQSQNMRFNHQNLPSKKSKPVIFTGPFLLRAVNNSMVGLSTNLIYFWIIKIWVSCWHKSKIVRISSEVVSSPFEDVFSLFSLDKTSDICNTWLPLHHHKSLKVLA